jgi:exosortase E/protease (VPEID-CTERM system)
VLLVIELVALQVRFDTDSLLSKHTWWSELLGEIHLLPQVGITLGAAWMMMAGGRGWGKLRQMPGSHRWWLLFLLGHGATLAFFIGLTGVVLEGDLDTSSACPEVWVTAWLVTGLATLALWGATVVSPDQWLPFIRGSFRIVLAGTFVGLAAWGAGQLTESVWEPLSRINLRTVHHLLVLSGQETVYQPEELVVGTTAFQVMIAAPCAGYEGLGLIWIFLGAYLWLFRDRLRFPQAFLLLPLGTLAIWLANVLRIATLVAIGTWLSPALATGGFHSAAGWLASSAVALGVVALANRSPFFTAATSLQKVVGASSATAAYLAPLLAILVTALFTRAFTEKEDPLYPLRLLVAGAVLWYYRRAYVELRCSWSWPALGIGLGAFVVWVALLPASSIAAADAPPWASVPRWWVGPWLIGRVLTTVIMVPLAEELAFRGYLPRRLLARDFQSVPVGHFQGFSFLLSSLLFGLLHERWFAGTLVGMLYACALYRRGELGDAVLAHATTNAFIAVSVLLGAWSLW